MNYVDIALIVILSLFVLYGFFFGFIHMLGSLMSSIVSFFIAGRAIDPIFSKVGFIFGSSPISKIVCFIVLFLIITKLIGLIFWLLGKVWDLVFLIPFAKSLDRLLGALMGFIEGFFIVGMILFYALKIIPSFPYRSIFDASSIVQYLIATISIIQIFFPQAIKSSIESAASSAIKSVVK